MKPETTGKIKFGIWGLILGAVIAMIVGFAWGGWTTAHGAQTMSEEAVLASHSAICVAQFMMQPDHEETLKEFEKLSTWDRAKFVEKGGWDKMPGQQESDHGVARACSSGLALLIKE